MSVLFCRLVVELLPKTTSKELRRRLTPTGPRKPRPVPAAPSSEPMLSGQQSSQSPAEAFRVSHALVNLASMAEHAWHRGLGSEKS